MLPLVGFLARCQFGQWTADETETQQKLAPPLHQFPFVCLPGSSQENGS